MRACVIAALAFASSTFAQQPATAPDLSGRTDDSIREVVRRVARRQLTQFGSLKDGDYPAAASIAEATAARKPQGIAWRYPWGVVLYGVLRSTDVTGDREVLDWVLEHNRIIARYYAWIEGVHRRVGDTAGWRAFIADNANISTPGIIRLGHLDACGAMGVQFLEGVLRHPAQVTPEQRVIVERVGDWIANKQDRLPDGTFWRPHSTNVSRIMDPGTLWIDDLYMACPYLIRWAKYTGDQRHLHDAAAQVINMAAKMQDTDGLWFHAYFEKEQKRSPWKWGRANGWAMVATVEILSVLPEDHPDRAPLLEILRNHIEGARKVQAASGLWRQVLDRPELWEETSCTAMFAYSMARAVNRGWIAPENMDVARRAFAGICEKFVTPEGYVRGTSHGTSIGLDVEYYANRPRPDDDFHGRGVVLLAGTEILAARKR